jgi:hypothetical protein
MIDQAMHYFGRVVHGLPPGGSLTLQQLRTKAGVYRPHFVPALAQGVLEGIVRIAGGKVIAGATAPREPGRAPKRSIDWQQQIDAELSRLRNA